MTHNPKLSVYIMTLKPKKSEEQKTFRDFLREKYAGDSTTSDVELLQRLFDDKNSTDIKIFPFQLDKEILFGNNIFSEQLDAYFFVVIGYKSLYIERKIGIG